MNFSAKKQFYAVKWYKKPPGCRLPAAATERAAALPALKLIFFGSDAIIYQ
jgi:hypothetical protein